MVPKRRVAAVAVVSALVFSAFAARLSLEQDGLALVEGMDPEAAHALRQFGGLDLLFIDVRMGPGQPTSLESLEALTRGYADSLRNLPSLKEVRFEVDGQEARKTFEVLFEHRFSLFDAPDQAQWQEGLHSARRDLMHAAAPLWSDLVSRDPLAHREKLQRLLSNLKPGLQLDTSRGTFVSLDHTHALILVVPHSRGLDIVSGRQVLRQLRDKVPAGIQVEFYGAHAFAEAAATQVRSDVEKAIATSLLAFVVVAFVIFRRFRFALAVFVPVAWGALGALALLSIAGVRLHGVTFGFGAVLLGIGVDYGVHLGVHYRGVRHERPELSPESAMFEALQQVRRGLLVGMTTTCIAFFTLLLSDVQILDQLVLWSVPALILCWVAARFALPALSQWLEGPVPPRWSAKRNLRLVLLAALLGTCAVSAWGLTALSFDGDVRSLDPQPAWMRAVERRFVDRYKPPRHPTMVIVRGTNEEQVFQRSDRVQSILRKAKDADLIASVRGLGSVLPSEKTQEQRLARHREASTQLSTAAAALDLVADFFAPYQKDLAQARPLTPADLSSTALSSLVERHLSHEGGKWAVMSLITMEGMAAARIPSDLQDGLLFLGAEVVSGELMARRAVDTIQRDISELSLLALLLVAVVLGVCYANPRALWACLLPVVVALIVTAGMQGILHIPINIVSVGAFALLAGVAVDYGVFITDALTRSEGLESAQRSVALAAVSTLLGFSSLLVADSPVMWTLGMAVTLGVAAAWATASIVLPLFASQLHALPRLPGFTGAAVALSLMAAIVVHSWFSGARNYGGVEFGVALLFDLAAAWFLWRRVGART